MVVVDHHVWQFKPIVCRQFPTERREKEFELVLWRQTNQSRQYLLGVFLHPAPPRIGQYPHVYANDHFSAVNTLSRKILISNFSAWLRHATGEKFSGLNSFTHAANESADCSSKNIPVSPSIIVSRAPPPR